MAKKQHSKIPTQEELDIYHLTELKQRFIPSPPPTRMFNIGQRVEYGAHQNTEILEMYDEFKFYKIRNWGIKIIRGIEYPVEDFQIVDWTQLLPYRTLDERKFKPTLIQNKDIYLNFLNMSISSLLSTYYSFGVDMKPVYQRDYVWSEDDEVNLIDSIFNNRTIGSYILIHNGYDKKYGYEVLDGKQRINAIVKFYEDRFKYKGKLFSELNSIDQYWFEEFKFDRAEIKGGYYNEGNVSLEQKIRIFLHVNTCGRVMDEAHLNKVKEMLKENV